VTAYMAGGEAFGEYVGQAYDSSADYWKLMEDGSLEMTEDGWLKDPNGNYILDEDGNRMGAEGIQEGLQNILGIGASEAVAMLRGEGFELRKEGVWWNHEGNAGRSIGLHNEQYAAIYEQSLSQHNTLKIYEDLVAAGQMDIAHEDWSVSTVDSNGDWTGRQPDVRYISYDEYKANNYISNPEGRIALDRAVESNNVTSPFGPRMHPITGEETFHSGVDWGVPSGTHFTPFLSGSVAGTGSTWYGGNTLTLEHELGFVFKGQPTTETFYTEYLHLASDPKGLPNVLHSIGDFVRSDKTAGITGNTGRSTGPHLHGGLYFEPESVYANWLQKTQVGFLESPRGVFFDPYGFMGGGR